MYQRIYMYMYMYQEFRQETDSADLHQTAI